MNTVLGKQTAAGEVEFLVTDKPVGVSANGLSGAEQVDVLYWFGAEYGSISDENGPLVLTATANGFPISMPGKYKMVKPVTANPTSLHVSKCSMFYGMSGNGQ